MPQLVTVERDYAAVAAKMAALGPLADTLGTGVKGVSWKPAAAVGLLGAPTGGSAAALPTGGPG